MDYALIILPVATFITSALTGVVGMGGGLLLLIILAEFLPFSVLIPVHGINQLVTHMSRAAVSIPAIDKKLTFRFAIGAILGVIFGSQFVLSVSEEVFKLLLGIFVLACLILPKNKLNFNSPIKWPIIGALTSFCGLFVGATGVLIAPFFLSEKLDKEQLVATKAACQVFIHGTKVMAFFILGFTLGPYLLLITLMCAMSFAGSFVSKKILNNISEKTFVYLFKFAIVVLALRLIFTGIRDSGLLTSS